MKIYVHHKKKITQETPYEKEIIWYDHFFKKTLTFNCSKLDFKYEKIKYFENNDGSKYTYDEVLNDYKEKFSHKYSDDEIEKYVSGFVKETMSLRPHPVTFSFASAENTSNPSDLQNWLKTYLNYNSSSASVLANSDKGIIFDVEKKEIDQFLYNLERSGFFYDLLD
jgi:hypothetical protein